MRTETEVKFLDVDHDEIRSRLKKLDAQCIAPMRMMRRALLNSPSLKKTKKYPYYLRLRDEGDKITLTFKQFVSQRVDGAQEVETIVESFDDTVSLFKEIGMEVQSLQESKRETWILNGCKIELDEWPWLKPYVEIEGDSEALLAARAKELNFNWAMAVFGDVMSAYRVQYPHLLTSETIAVLEKVSFGTDLPALLQNKK